MQAEKTHFSNVLVVFLTGVDYYRLRNPIRMPATSDAALPATLCDFPRGGEGGVVEVLKSFSTATVTCRI